jgi:DNA-binding NarL/FixJ family response regulator
MILKGAGGYILKESAADELVRAIESVYLHDYFINEQVSGKLIGKGIGNW